MTAAERLFWLRVQQRASGLAPDLRAAILRGLRYLRETLNEAEVTRLIRGASVDRFLSETFDERTLDTAFRALRESVRDGVVTSGRLAARDLPGEARGVAFDTLSPHVVDGIRLLDDWALSRLSEDVRETARAYVENGIRDGVAPQTIARGLRDVIGLAPNQEQAVRNFRRMLEAGDREALTRLLRDRRFDATLRKALGPDGTGLSPAQIERMAGAYRQRMVGFNAETNARTLALDAQKLGQRLTWEDAVRRGDIDGAKLTKRWAGVMDDRERPEHVAMEGETVGWDEAFSNGEMVPGESTFNCRCVAIYSTRGRLTGPVTLARTA